MGSADVAGAESAYRDALAADPGSYPARVGLARVATAKGNLDEAIHQLSTAVAAVPLPDLLARRGDLYTIRAAPGDASRAADDYAAVEAIAKLAGFAGTVYDRTLALFLADQGQQPGRAVALAQGELAARKDPFGRDAEPGRWRRPAARPEADAAMTSTPSPSARRTPAWTCTPG